MEKDFYVSAINLVIFKYITVCIYRLPDIDFWILLKNLEKVIQLVHSRNKRIILCCDRILHFMQENINLQESTESIRGS